MIAIDSVPYNVIVDLSSPTQGNQQLFSELKGPTAVVNAFPADSYTAWTGLLEPFGVEIPPGYIGQYFDRDEMRVRGFSTPKKERAPWREFFDWRLKGAIQKFIVYGTPVSSGQREIEEAFEAFAESDADFFSVYFMSTDALAHLEGPASQKEFLRTLDAELDALRRSQTDRPFYTVMVSDHGVAGGEPLENIFGDVRKAMRKAGFDRSNQITEESDAVIIALGLLTNVVVYTDIGKEMHAAETLAAVEGIDLCVVREAHGWRVLSTDGEARFASRRGSPLQWKYEPVRGDPLGYLPITKALQAIEQSPDGWISDTGLFEATWSHRFPDALYRLAQSFDLVVNDASVHCSVAVGYMFGPRTTEYLAIPTVGKMKWTHGALERDTTLGFLMSDLPEWTEPEAVRYDRALEFLKPYVPNGTSVD